MLYLGNVPSGTTLYIPFHTFNSSGASVTISGLAVTDIEIYKNGSSTQRASDNGYTLLDTDGIDFGGVTGVHGFSVDLADNSDSGFFAVGSWYWVVVSSITADGQTVSFVAAVFRIVAAETTAGYPLVGLNAAGLEADAVTEVWGKASTQPSAVPSTTATPLEILAYLLAKMANKQTQTATTNTLRNRADNATISTATTSDDGTTFTRTSDT